jgi:hypothetical protein
MSGMDFCDVLEQTAATERDVQIRQVMGNHCADMEINEPGVLVALKSMSLQTHSSVFQTPLLIDNVLSTSWPN